MADGAPSRTLAWFERQLNSRKAEPVTDDRTPLAMLSEQLADAVATAGAALVAVHARPRLPSTGVHWRDGVVVTTEGTVRREDDIAVTLPDGRRIPATLAGRDRGTDLAVLRIASASLPVATLGDPATLRPGHLVLALARLDAGGPRAAFGAVSATGGKWRCWKGGEIDSWLQSDLDIYPGFGGGPLVDATGRIHGVNSGGLSRALATTIPVATVNRVMTQLLERGYVARGWLGAAMQAVRLDPATQQRLKSEAGLLLLSVEADAPAVRAELLVGGIAWSGDLFVTSAHVVTASDATIVTPDGRAVPGEVVRRDAERDIAVVRAAGAGVAAAVPGDPHALRPGSLVFAVGHPFGVRDAVSVGVLQAVSPLPRGYGLNGNGSFVWIQADVRLGPGNSGGPAGGAQGRGVGVGGTGVAGIALA